MTGVVSRQAASEIEIAVSEESAKLTQAGEAKRSALHAAVGTQAATMEAHAANAYASTVAALTEREHRTRGMFAAARANVLATAAGQVTLAQADAMKARVQLRAEGSGVTSHVRDAAEAEARRMKVAADSAARTVAASGATLRSEILGRPVGNLHREIQDLTDQEADGIKNEIFRAKLGAAGEVLHADQQGAETLCKAAADNGAAFAEAASAIEQQVGDKLPEVENGINSGSLAVVTAIETMAGSQLAAIDAAERDALAGIAEAKTQAVNFLGAGRIAARELAGKADATIAQLATDEATALEQLHAAGERAVDQIATQATPPGDQVLSFARRTRARLKEDAHSVLASVDHSATAIVGQLGTVAAAFGAAVYERRDRMVSDLDKAIGLTDGMLTTSLRDLATECKKVRADATSTYAAAESQLVANAQPGMRSARDTWAHKADEFITSVRAYESLSLGKHARVRTELPATMTRVVHDMGAYLRRSTARRIWDGVKHGIGTIASALDTFVLAVLGLATILLVVFGTAFVGLAVAIAAIVVGAVVISTALLTSLYRRASLLLENDWPWYAKILGIPAVLGAAVGDVLGLSAIVESLRGRELISNRALATENRAASMTEGLFQLLTLGIVPKVMRARPGREAPRAAREPSLDQELPPEMQASDATTSTDTMLKEGSAAGTPDKSAQTVESPLPKAARESDTNEISVEAHAPELATPKGHGGLTPSEREPLVTSGATAHELDVVDRMAAIDPAKTRELLAEYSGDVLEGLRSEPFTDIAALEHVLARLRERVRSRVHGLYEGIIEAPDGWKFDTTVQPAPDGSRVAETWAYPQGGRPFERGFFETGYDPKTGTLLLKRAFMQDHGQSTSLPKFIARQPDHAEMLSGKGTPTMQYVTLHQLKKLGVPMGSTSGLKTIHLDNIQNVETLVHLHYLKTVVGLEESLAFRATDSMRHAETTANQAGYRLVGEPMVGRAWRAEIGEVCHYQELTDPKRIAIHDAILAKFGYDRSTMMKVGFNVDFNVEPAP